MKEIEQMKELERYILQSKEFEDFIYKMISYKYKNHYTIFLINTYREDCWNAYNGDIIYDHYEKDFIHFWYNYKCPNIFEKITTCPYIHINIFENIYQKYFFYLEKTLDKIFPNDIAKMIIWKIKIFPNSIDNSPEMFIKKKEYFYKELNEYLIALNSDNKK